MPDPQRPHEPANAPEAVPDRPHANHPTDAVAPGGHPAGSGPDDVAADDWRAKRARAVAAHGDALVARQARETARAREMVAAFVRDATERRLPAVPLRALPYSGGSGYRTDLRGWYIHPDRSVAVGVDGGYYVLGVPASLRARLTGARVAPSDPPLIVGEGARDGASAPLTTLLAQALAGGWP
jgi:hypothetical protein